MQRTKSSAWSAFGIEASAPLTLTAVIENQLKHFIRDQVEVMPMGDQICVMRGGDIIEVADPLTDLRFSR